MGSNVKLDLIYFKMRAFAEPAQLLLSYGNLEYKYHMAWDYYNKSWDELKETIPFGQLPLLVVNDEIKIWQSGSIVRYISNLIGKNPRKTEELGKVDALFESSQELLQPLNMTINFLSGDAFEKNKELVLGSFKPKLSYFNRIIETSGGPFFYGSEPFYCDFGIYHQFSLLRLLDEQLFKDTPLISSFMGGIENLSGVKEYLGKRPELIGVSSCPQLVIDGKAVATGASPD